MKTKRHFVLLALVLATAFAADHAKPTPLDNFIRAADSNFRY
jgi:hypothetical protein